MPSVLDLARGIEAELIALRRDLHQHPETAWQEVRTGQKAADFCGGLGLRVERVKTGTIATLNAEKPGPILALRADMDALPIQEENDIPYKSLTPGKAHLCGHDAHTAMLLGAVKILAAERTQIPFPVRFIFQPAEEAPPCGAPEIIKAGYLEGVSEIFGLHLDTLMPVGTLGTRIGPLMASMDRLTLHVTGRGGHGALPHLALDPVLAAAEIILALQSIVARRIAPVEPAVVSVCQMDAGTAFNVIPASARLIGTARSLNRENRDKIEKWIEEIAVNVARAHGQEASLKYERGTPVLVNHAAGVSRMQAAFRALGGTVVESKPTMGGEDFAYYLEKVPGCFAFLGASGGTPETSHGLHHPCFNFDERALAWGTAVLVQMVRMRGLQAENS